MKKLLVFTSIIFTLNVEQSLGDENVRVQCLKQKLDHFDPNNLAQWNMKFMSIDTYHEDGGPMFISVGGEDGITNEHFVKGHFFDIGKELQAYFFQTEHRYYGDSLPTPDMSVPNLRYLNMRQAIDDLAHFIRAMKQIYARLADSKVILNGISYAGGLVFWFKHLYPDLVDGVWASSPALFGLLNFHEAGKIVGDSIKLVGAEQCYERIKKGLAILESMMTKEKEDEVKQLLNFCEFDASNEMDVWNLFASIYTVFANTVQVHSPANKEINKICEIVNSESNDWGGIVEFLKRKMFFHQPCNDITFSTTLMAVAEETFKYANTPRPWEYQKCSEFGWFQTSDNPDTIFKSIPLTYFVKRCASALGGEGLDIEIVTLKMAQKINKVNAFYQTLAPRTSNMIVTHGELDPWKAVGTLPHIEVEMIPLIGHGIDTYSLKSKDRAKMRQAKEKIKNLIRMWISETS